MAGQLLGLIGIVVLVLVLRERALYGTQQRKKKNL